VSARRTCIGVFDSGFGGLTVLKALLRLIPDADYLYFGDTARLPYGSKSAETVARYAVGAAHYLEQRGAQALVIACNTATALALDKITQAARVPVVGVIEPGTERAAGEGLNKKVVVIGTEATVSSHAYLKALEARGMQAREKACPLLVPLVEEGWIDNPVTEEVARIYPKKLSPTNSNRPMCSCSAARTIRSSDQCYPRSHPSMSRSSTPPMPQRMPLAGCCAVFHCPPRLNRSAASCLG